jgi:hypothetical protein
MNRTNKMFCALIATIAILTTTDEVCASGYLSESTYLDSVSYSGSINAEGKFDFTVEFPIGSGVKPSDSVRIMTEHEASIRASDNFVSLSFS